MQPLRVLVLLASYASIINALKQPTCDDNGPEARALFHSTACARSCLAALEDQLSTPTAGTITKELQLHTIRESYINFATAVENFEPVQDRLCQWQRLVKFPPRTLETHDRAWRPLGQAWEVMRAVEGVVNWGGSGMRELQAACEGASLGKCKDIRGKVVYGRDEL
ncbi:hypothetical protein LTR62_004565 [Meristemomyces frigidus]|uniref:Karyogamy protein 5 n=1 Tax=Meristemomyces frigidus TaxID=1508187 RepID=A0AAN7TH31_9PEZI|nr:hypothetical protein LTR62_004565 [Meristemomyces frigidus]